MLAAFEPTLIKDRMMKTVTKLFMLFPTQRMKSRLSVPKAIELILDLLATEPAATNSARVETIRSFWMIRDDFSRRDSVEVLP